MLKVISIIVGLLIVSSESVKVARRQLQLDAVGDLQIAIAGCVAGDFCPNCAEQLLIITQKPLCFNATRDVMNILTDFGASDGQSANVAALMLSEENFMSTEETTAMCQAMADSERKDVLDTCIFPSPFTQSIYAMYNDPSPECAIMEESIRTFNDSVAAQEEYEYEEYEGEDDDGPSLPPLELTSTTLPIFKGTINAVLASEISPELSALMTTYGGLTFADFLLDSFPNITSTPPRLDSGAVLGAAAYGAAMVQWAGTTLAIAGGENFTDQIDPLLVAFADPTADNTAAVTAAFANAYGAQCGFDFAGACFINAMLPVNNVLATMDLDIMIIMGGLIAGLSPGLDPVLASPLLMTAVMGAYAAVGHPWGTGMVKLASLIDFAHATEYGNVKDEDIAKFGDSTNKVYTECKAVGVDFPQPPAFGVYTPSNATSAPTIDSLNSAVKHTNFTTFAIALCFSCIFSFFKL